MSYSKTIVCLANSRKITGRCIAGKEVFPEGYGCWIRPVSSRLTEEISEEERLYEDGTDPELLDIILIPMIEPRPKAHQIENHLIDDRKYWVKVGKLAWDKLPNLADRPQGPLWFNSGSSYNGLNDRIPLSQAERFQNSLFLIESDGLSVRVAVEGAEFGTPKRKVRANFRYQGYQYILAVTDPDIERMYLARKNGEYSIDEAYLCVSLGDVYERISAATNWLLQLLLLSA